MEMLSKNVRRVKICVLGEGGAGKSALVLQYIQSYFAQDYDPTIEDTYSKQTQLNGETIIFDILDTAGQDEYSSLREAQVIATEAIIICYRIDVRESLNSIYSIHQQILRGRGDLPPTILVGTMSDLDAHRQISYSEGANIAKKLGMTAFFETSSKLRTNINQTFELAASEALKARNIQPIKHRSNTGSQRSSQAGSGRKTSPVQPQPQRIQQNSATQRASSDARRISRATSRTSSPLTTNSQRVAARTYQNQPPDRTRTPKPNQPPNPSQKDPAGCCTIV